MYICFYTHWLLNIQALSPKKPRFVASANPLLHAGPLTSERYEIRPMATKKNNLIGPAVNGHMLKQPLLRYRYLPYPTVIPFDRDISYQLYWRSIVIPVPRHHKTRHHCPQPNQHYKFASSASQPTQEINSDSTFSGANSLPTPSGRTSPYIERPLAHTVSPSLHFLPSV